MISVRVETASGVPDVKVGIDADEVIPAKVYLATTDDGRELWVAWVDGRWVEVEP